MDARALIDQLLQSGRDLVKQGQAMAEKKLEIPPTGPERETALSGLGKGAAIGGLLALLLGTKSGRSVTGSALKLGSLAAIGGIAYQAFRDWQARHGGTPSAAGAPVDQLTGPKAQERSLALLRALIAAAKADGHIDDAERARIDAQLNQIQLQQVDTEIVHFLHEELAKPLNVREVASSSDSPEAAVEIYLASLTMIDQQNARERAYLKDLAQALDLSPALIETLELQVKNTAA